MATGNSKIFIDGHAGTTGLRIREWLADRTDLELLEIDSARRKDPDARREFLQQADLAVLCLPDDAAREAVGWLSDAGTRVLDASTAHRIAPGWVYGLPELCPEQRAAIRDAQCVSNPGCYPSGVILALLPLLDAGLVGREAAIVVHAVSGYSGGGRTKIEQWEDPDTGLQDLPFEALYSLDARHKHIPEMKRECGLSFEPHFRPSVGPFRCGMRIEIPLHASLLAASTTAKQIWEVLDARYRGERFVKLHPVKEPRNDTETTFDPRVCNDTNRIELHVIGHPGGHVWLVAVLDNLGKGAAGVAIQNLNCMLGVPEDRGLSA